MIHLQLVSHNLHKHKHLSQYSALTTVYEPELCVCERESKRENECIFLSIDYSIFYMAAVISFLWRTSMAASCSL